jgi:hypothetical protein
MRLSGNGKIFPSEESIAIELSGGLFTLTATDWVTGGQCIIIL